MFPAFPRTRPGLTAGFVLALASAVILGADAAEAFSRLPGWIVAAAGVICSLWLAVSAGWAFFRRRLPGRLHAALLTCLMASIALSANAIMHGWLTARLTAAAAAGIPNDIKDRAGRIHADLQGLLERMSLPLEQAYGRLASLHGGPAQAFELVEDLDDKTEFTGSSSSSSASLEGRGISLYDALGGALAWAGTSYPPPDGLLDGLPRDTITYRAAVEAPLTRLYALLPAGESILVTEVTVESRLDPHLRDNALRALAGDAGADLRMQDFRDEATGFADYLAREGELAEGSATGERKSFFVGLRAPGKDFLGYVRLQAEGRADLRRRIDAAHREAAAVILAAFFACLCLVCFLPGRPAPRSGGWHAPASSARLVSGLAVVWGGRMALSWFPLRLTVSGTNWFDPSLFASAGFFHLLRSPGDLLLTMIAVFATALLLNSAGGLAAQAAASSRWRWALAATGAAGLAALAWLTWSYAPLIAVHLVRNSAVDLLDVSPLAPHPPILLMQASILLSLLSVFLLAQGAINLIGAAGGGALKAARRLAPGPGDPLSRWALSALLPGIVLAAIAYDPLFVPAGRIVIESIFEGTFMPWVKGQHKARDATLRETMDALQVMPDLSERIATEEDRSQVSLALDLWLRTPLGTSGYDASLKITDEDGNLVSRFSRNLPPALDARNPEPHDMPPGEPISEPTSFIGLLTKRILHAHHDVYDNGRLAGTVTVHILDEPDNLPFLTPETPYARALAPQARRIEALPPTARGVRQVVYDSSGDPDMQAQSEVPRLPEHWTDLLVVPGAYTWSDQVEGGKPARYIFFGSDRRIYALGFPCPTPMERTARSLRMLFLGLELLVLILAPAALLAEPRRLRRLWSSLPATLGRSHYRKLLTTFTTVTLIPLVVLSVLVSRYINAELEQDIEDRGRQGLQSAGSLVRTMLDLGDKPTPPDDDTLYWLSLQVGKDVNLYRGGELIATSRRELFSSGLLPPRLEGRIYRALEIEGRRLVMGHETLRGYDYRTITTPIVTGSGQRAGLLSLPLDAHAAEARQRSREVGDVLLITSLLMVVLTGAVGYALARRVSRPIRLLSAAAARITSGDLDAAVDAHPRDETGELIASFNVMARAIKEQRCDLERRKDYIEKILRNVTIGVISMDRAGAVVTSNPAAGAILDLPDLKLGAHLAQLLSKRPALGPLARAREAPRGTIARDVEMSPGGPGSERTVRARVVPFLEGEGIILLLEDMTETVRSNRLAAWAEMARRIAHEIKNPLTPIQLSAEHIRRVYAEGSPGFPEVLEECLMTIMAEVASLREISSEFSTYARIPTPRREPTDVRALLEEVVRPYKGAVPPGISLRLDLADDLPAMEVDRSLMGRALVNLIENALQAMPKGGSLSVRARRDGNHVAVEVADTGVGMDPAALGKIFEPYFSTKDTGTGLGLAIARKAVEEHGGTIEVASAAGAGTTMRILLPVEPLAVSG